MNPRVARAMRAAHRQFADGGDVQDNRSMFGRAADTAMDYVGRGLALGDLYTGGMLSSLAGLNPFTSYSDVMAAREKALAGVPRDAKALATEPINPVAAIFAGPMARTANKVMLRRAEELAAQNAPREQIWNETGWFQGPDKKWRFEIDDSQARLRRRGDEFEPQWRSVADKQDDYPALESLLRHKSLREAYPSVMRSDVKLLPRSSDYDAQYLNGEFSVNRNLPRDQVKPAMLHEGQHAIQDLERFAQQGKYQNLTDDEYRRIASEVEARTVEKRLNMTPQQRRARAPWLDYDVPEAEQIVRQQ